MIAVLIHPLQYSVGSVKVHQTRYGETERRGSETKTPKSNGDLLAQVSECHPQKLLQPLGIPEIL
jgi:hypothetical protein